MTIDACTSPGNSAYLFPPMISRLYKINKIIKSFETGHTRAASLNKSSAFIIAVYVIASCLFIDINIFHHL